MDFKETKEETLRPAIMRGISLVSAAALSLTLCACSQNAATNSTRDSNNSNATEQTASISTATIQFTSNNDFIDKVEKDVNDTLDSVTQKYDALVAEIGDYDAYVANYDKVKSFYSETLATQKETDLRLREYASAYAQMVVSSSAENKDKYKDLKDIYDVVYDDAEGDLYKGIYDGAFKDIYDAFYDGVLKDAYNTIPYDEWYDAKSTAYDDWYSAKSDAYDEWYETKSDVYDFWNDVRSEVLDNDLDRAQSKIDKFNESISKLKSA